MNYYVDTCIWRDYFEDRGDNLKPIGDFAFYFFKKTLENKDTLLFSSLVITELATYNFDFIKLSSFFGEIIKEVKISEKTNCTARAFSKLEKIPMGDAVHYILAKENNAILVSRDKHLLFFSNVKTPEELI
jgi:predicted nucleic acid-binding protein